MESAIGTLLLAAQLLFPTVTGRSLSKVDHTVPADFQGKARIVVVAFSSKQQKLVDTWIPSLKAIAAEQPDVRWYELPVISRGYKWMRGIIDGGMRGGVEDESQRAVTITLYLDASTFRQNLRISTDETIQVLLLDQQNYVRWRVDGQMSDDKLANLKAAMGELLRE
jgi:hypothetical protein